MEHSTILCPEPFRFRTERLFERLIISIGRVMYHMFMILEYMLLICICVLHFLVQVHFLLGGDAFNGYSYAVRRPSAVASARPRHRGAPAPVHAAERST